MSCPAVSQATLKALLSLLKAPPRPELKSPSHHCTHAGVEIRLCCGLVLAVGLCVLQSGSLLPGEVFGWSVLFSAFELSEYVLAPVKLSEAMGKAGKCHLSPCEVARGWGMKAAQLSKVGFRFLASHCGEHAHQGYCTASPSHACLCLH